MWGDLGMGWGWGAFSVMHMVLSWSLIIVGIALLVKIAGSRSGANSGSQALDILAERYAKGEINKDEFEQKRGDISRGAQAPLPRRSNWIAQ